MAKVPKDDSKEVKQLLEKLYSAVKTLNDTSRSLTQNNRDLLKVMALLQSGFAQSEEDAQKLIGEVKEGLEITDEFAVKWAKQRKATKKDVDEIIKKFRELEEVDESIIDNSKDYIDLLDQRYDSFKSELDITNNLLKSHQQILQTVRESKKAAQQLGGSIIDIDKGTESLVRKKLDINGLFSGMFSEVVGVEDLIGKVQGDIQTLINNTSGTVLDFQLNFNPYSADLDSEIDKVMTAVQLEKNARLDGLDDFFDKNAQLQTNLTRKIASQMSKMKGLDIDIDTGKITKSGVELKRGTTEYQKVIGNLSKTIEKNDIGSKIAESFKEIVQLIGQGEKATESQKKRLQELISPLDLSTKLVLEQYQIHMKDLDAYEHGVQMQKETYKLLSENLHLLSTTESIVQRIGAGFDYVNAIMPLGIGEFLGLSKVSMSLMDGHRKGVQSFVDTLQTGADRTAAIKNYMKELGPSIKMALNPMTLLVASGVLLFNMLTNVVGQYKEMSQEMKISILQASKLLQVQLDIITSQKNQFATLKDIQDAQAEMIGTSGKVFDITDRASKELTISLVEASKAFGYTVQEAVQLHKVFKNIGADDKLALQLEQNLGLMSEMAGLSPQIVSRDLIDASETVSTYFASLPDKAAKAAIQVRRMGLSLQKAGEIAQEMLNLEGFMTNMYELQAMSGGGIDFSRAFEKGLMGDIEGMTEDIMKNIGSTAEFNKMDYLTRIKISKTLGMSVDELAKSVRLREQMQGLGQSEQDYLTANLDKMGDISNLSQDEIRNRLQQLQSTDRLGVAWDKIKGTLLKALIPLAESFADAIDAISPLIDIIIGGLKFVGMLIKPIVPLVKGLLAPFKLIGDVVSSIMERLDGWFDPLSNVNDPLKTTRSMLSGIGDVVYWIGTGLSTWFVGKKILGSLGIVKEGMGSIKSIIPAIGTVFGSVFSSSEKKSKESSQKIIQDNTLSLASVSKAAKTTSEQIQDASLKSAKNSNFVNPGITKSSFKLIGAMGASVLAKFAVNSAMTFFNVRKDGEEQIGGLTESSIDMFSNMSMIIGPLLSTSLSEGIERVFTKRIEKNIEGRLADPIKKATKRFSGLGSTSKGIFGKILNAGKKTFQGLSDIGSKLLPTVFNPMTTSFDKFSGKVDGTTSTVVDTVKEIKNIVPETNIHKKVSEKVSKKREETVTSTTRTNDISKPISKTKSVIESGFDTVANIIERSSKIIKTVIGDLTKIISTSMKDISSGVGTSIKNLLKGIGDGLSSFKTSAVKGAASLLIVSGALWVTSKALQNFANVKWEDIGKGILTLGGLVAVSMILGKSSPQMLLASIAIAALGASLIPAAYALNKFNEVDWSSLGKAGVALIGLGVIGSLLSSVSPALLLGSVAIAALGASIIPLAYSMKMFNDIEWSSLGKAGVALVGFGVAATAFGAISPLILLGSLALTGASIAILSFTGSVRVLSDSLVSVDTKPLVQLKDDLIGLNDISSSKIFEISGSITTLAGSLLALNASSALGNLLGGSALSDLEKLGKLSDPLYIVQNSISGLSGSLVDLFNVFSKLDFSALDKLNNFDIQDMNYKVQQQIESKIQSVPNQAPSTSQFKMLPVQPQQPIVQSPKKESVAQNVKIDPLRDIKVQQEIQKQKQQEQEQFDIYNRPELATKKLELLLMQANQLLEVIARKDTDVYMDGQRLTAINKKFNNNK